MNLHDFTICVWTIAVILAAGCALVLIALAYEVGRETWSRAPMPVPVRVIHRIYSDDHRTWTDLEFDEQEER